MALINSDYFINDIALPNLEEVQNTFEDVMDRYQEQYMKYLLGYDLYKLFDTTILGGEPYDQIWDDFINGAEFSFEFCGKTVTQMWNGLVNGEEISLLSYFTYYEYRKNNASTTTSINDVQGLPENAVKVNDVPKRSNAHNKGLELYGEIPLFAGFDKYSDTYEYYNDEPSAYNFLNANRADYPTWRFKPLGRTNSFGI